MTDIFFWIAIIGVVFYFVYSHTYWFRDIDQISENIAKKLIKETEKSKERYKEWKTPMWKESAEKAEEQLNKFAKAYDQYCHLKERFKHDRLGGQVRKDWEAYLRSTETLFECAMDYGALNDEKLLNNTGRRHRKVLVTMEEIEKRFDKLSSLSVKSENSRE